LGQKEEGRLTHVFGVVGVLQDATTGGENHRSMAVNQSLKRDLVLPVNETLEEFPIRDAGIEMLRD